jgi:hypothetical protein
MRLTLVVPDVFLPQQIALNPSSPRLPGLETLLARGTLQRGAGRALEQWLLDAWTLTDAPVAPLTLLADGMAPGTDTWMRADPVHLNLEGNHVRLFDHHAFNLDQREAGDLVAALNKHFARDSLEFHAPHPTRWYLRIPAHEAPQSTPLWRVAGRSVFEYLPISGGKSDWKSFANEAQMLLFEHPVNNAREIRGEHAINGVWFWGAGALTQACKSQFATVLADAPLARGLATHSGAGLGPIPDNFHALDAILASDALVVLDSLADARWSDDATWSSARASLERNWFAPALEALKNNKLRTLRLCLPSDRVTLEVTVRSRDLYRFWRSVRPLENYA